MTGEENLSVVIGSWRTSSNRLAIGRYADLIETRCSVALHHAS